MRKRLLRKLHRTKSKRGLSLVELIVGVTILVIVFGGTMSAMANGYTDTLYNAQQNKGAADGASLNEVIMEAVKAKGFADEEECAEYFAGDPNMDDTNAIHAAALEVDRELVQGDERKKVRYVAYDRFPLPDFERQYTIITDAQSTVDGTFLSERTIEGVEIRTAVKTVKGWVINKSFVPYGSNG